MLTTFRELTVAFCELMEATMSSQKVHWNPRLLTASVSSRVSQGTFCELMVASVSSQKATVHSQKPDQRKRVHAHGSFCERTVAYCALTEA